MGGNQPDIQTIFGEALARETPESRAAYLDEACGDDTQLRDQLEGLLQAHQQAGGFLGGTSPGSDQTGSAATSAQNPWYAAPTVAELAEHFPQLEILELLGEGGMGAVYKARQPKLDRLVALKILPPRFSSDPNFAERFVREAQALAKLNHPNIITVYDFGDSDGLFYFLMEYVDGVNLRQSIEGGRLTPEEALAIVPQVCDALQFAHDEGIVHRDIKPENVLLDKKGRVKIADFGLAKLLGHTTSDQRLTISHQVMGTPHYMAPEQVTKPLEVDHRADIYSLGVVFYELLTGELPLGRFDPPSAKSAINTELDRVVMRSLEREPDRRYQRASEIKTDVEELSASDRPPRQAAAAPLPPTPDNGDATPNADKEARQNLKTAGIALIVLGSINIVLPIVTLLGRWFLVQLGILNDVDSGWFTMRFPPTVVFWFFSVVFGMIMLLSGIEMLRIRSYGLSRVGAFAALIPYSPTLLVSLPLGIWMLSMLGKPEVKALFGSRTISPGAAIHDSDQRAPLQQVQGPAIAMLAVVAINVVVVGLTLTMAFLTIMRQF